MILSAIEADVIVGLVEISFSEGIGPTGMWELLKRIDVEMKVPIPKYLRGYMEQACGDDKRERDDTLDEYDNAKRE